MMKAGTTYAQSKSDQIACREAAERGESPTGHNPSGTAAGAAAAGAMSGAARSISLYNSTNACLEQKGYRRVDYTWDESLPFRNAKNEEEKAKAWEELQRSKGF